MEDFLATHKPLIKRLARSYARERRDTGSSEDIAREIEIELTQIAKAHGVAVGQYASPVSYIRRIVKHAAARAKRRHTLVEQVGAGDDLTEVSRELSELDADLPDAPPLQPTSDSLRTRERIITLLQELPPRDALIGAMWLEDQCDASEIAQLLSLPESEVDLAIDRVKLAAESIQCAPSIPPGVIDSRPRMLTREQELREYCLRAADDSPPDRHLDTPLLVLVRGGDHSDDLEDAVRHLSRCALCRARLEQGATAGTRSVVVVAIEAPRASEYALQRVADSANAHLFERGGGRWTAVVDAAHASALAEELDNPSSSLVSRVALGAPFEVAAAEESTLPPPRGLVHDDAKPERGTDAAELQAWVEVARKRPHRSTESVLSLGWLSFAVVTIGASAGVAYYLATR